jgi:peptidoglycan/xylan/chitin deacetylase (PgdA/CDA1 family)
VALDNKKFKINQLTILLTGLLILAGSVLVYVFILKGVYGRFSNAELLPDFNAVKKVVFGVEPKVAILYSKYTENMLPEGDTWVNDNIETWSKFIGESKYKYDIIDDHDIEKGKLFNYELLIIPGTKSLSDKEIVQIKEFVNDGGSIFASGGIASFSEIGKWRGWEFLSEVFGVKFTKEMNDSDYTKIHTLRGGLSLTANIPSGYPLKIATWDRPIAVEVLDPRTIQASFWYNYRLEGGLTREEIKKTAGIVYGNYGSGRFVWLGFDINSVVGIQEDYIYFDRFFQNCMHWLTYMPIAYIKNWPGDYDAAAVITLVLSNDIQNVDNLLPILSGEKVKAAFFINASTAIQNENLVRSLTKYGEIGAISDIGYLESTDDTLNHLDDPVTQFQKIQYAKNTIESISKSKVNGFLPYYGLFDNNTLRALINTKYNYIFTDSLTDRSVPRTIVLGDNRVSILTKTARDDYEVIRDYNLTNTDFQFYTYQEDVDRILFEKGMYVFKIHTPFQCKPGYVGVIDSVIKDLKRKNFWIATPSEIQQWYSSRDRLEIRTEKRGDSRAAVNISNPGNFTVNNLVIEVDLNNRAKNISLETEIIGTKEASFRHQNGSNKVYLYINNLKAGESRTYYVDYDKINS